MFLLFSFCVFNGMYTFGTFFWACLRYLKDWFLDTSSVLLIKKVTPMLGPSYLQKYIYTAQKQTYCVILNTTFTSFNEFKKTLNNTPKLSIPNRAIRLDSINIKKFNMYNGPLCNFCSTFSGVYVPYSIDFFCSTSNLKNHPSVHVIYDILGNENTFVPMKSIRSTVWLPDCLRHLKKTSRNVTMITNEKSD